MYMSKVPYLKETGHMLINASQVYKFEVCGSNIRKCEKGAHNNFSEIFYLTKYIKNVIMSTCK